ncbi:MAG TPA: sortase [Lacisediminihabitans sp.]|uniref:sortase n=1 Tax=Lacisediminihabitans sp. TaxID=2787631 RepID=UPI002ED90ED4
MIKKAFAVAALVAVAIFAGPVAANAAGYVADDQIIVSDSTPAPGSTQTVTFTAGSFLPGEEVSFSVTGEGPITLAAVRAAVVTASITKTAAADGSIVLRITLPTDAVGTYNVTGTGLTSGTVGTAVLTVAAADAGSGLAFTGANVSPLLIWGAGGVLLLGIALLVVMTVVRRQQRSNA